eukprot:4641932-Pleurochrysis_carterae.AAC.1
MEVRATESHRQVDVRKRARRNSAFASCCGPYASACVQRCSCSVRLIPPWLPPALFGRLVYAAWLCRSIPFSLLQLLRMRVCVRVRVSLRVCVRVCACACAVSSDVGGVDRERGVRGACGEDPLRRVEAEARDWTDARAQKAVEVPAREHVARFLQFSAMCEC